MKSLLVLILALCFMVFAELALSQEPAAHPTIEAALQAAEAAPQDGILAPVEADYKPPEWLQKTLNTIDDVPVVGPYLVKFLEWVSVIGTMLTALVTFLLVCLKALARVVSIAKLERVALLLSSFEKSKLLYWMKYFSLYNAKKEEKNV